MVGVWRMNRAGRDELATPPDMRVAHIAAGQNGCISNDQLRRCGLDKDAVARRVRKGQLHRLHTGVYAVGHPGETLHGQFMAAVLAGGDDACLSRWASAALAGLVRWDGRPIDVSITGTSHRARPGIRFHRARTLHRRDVTRLHGIRTTTPARVLLEIAPQLSDTRLKRLVRQAQAERLANTRQIADVLARANGHAATARIAAIIASGPAPTASGHEDVVLDLVLQAGLEHPVVNGPVRTHATTYYPDLRWPARQLILEIDSGWHDGHVAQGLDAGRQADLEAVGERVLRTTREQAVRHPSQLVARLIAAGAPRARRPRQTAPYTDRQP